MLAHFISNPSQVFLLLIDVANLVIGICVLLRDPKQLVNRTFFIFVLGTFAWSAGISLLYITHDFMFDKVILGGGLFMFFGLTLFARVFPSRVSLPFRFYGIFIPILVAAECLPFNLFIHRIYLDKAGFIQPINGPLFPFYVAIAVSYVSLSIYFLIQTFRKSNGNSKMQMLYFGMGISIFMTSIVIFNVILPALGVYKLNLIGPATSIVFVLMTSYAIARHQLMDIRIVLQRGTIYSLLLSLMVAAYLSSILVTKFFFENYEPIADPLFDTGITIFGIMAVPPLERYFQKITNRFFFKQHYEYSVALEELSVILNTNIQMGPMALRVLQALDNILHPSSLEFFHNVTGELFKFPEHNQDSQHSGRLLAADDETRVIVISDTKTVGTFILGPKRSGDPYTREDFTLLRTFAAQAAVSFEKAELYEELQDYSKSLEEKVDARTEKLTQMGEVQRQLFDDISHALQTPLTIIKGVLELDEGKTNKVSHGGIMEQCVDDLSRLIREILQLARMDSVPIEVETARFNLTLLIKNVIEYVEVVCQQYGIQIESKLAPNIELIGDQKQIEEAITNLLSNAVHYTSNCDVRKITIYLTETSSSIELCISDTGVGISPERLPYIFDRFYRSTERDNSEKIGYGLGLAIVKRIVERHEGSIRVDSNLGKGTRFTIRFQTVSPESIVEPELKTQA